MSKYIDRSDRIKNELTNPKAAHLDGIDYALKFLDANLVQAPGQTITESDFCEAVDKTDEWTDEGFARTVLDRLGITVIPDPEPEPTNLQRLTRAIRDWDEGRGADRILARHLDAIGVKASDDD